MVAPRMLNPVVSTMIIAQHFLEALWIADRVNFCRISGLGPQTVWIFLRFVFEFLVWDRKRMCISIAIIWFKKVNQR